jgi:hypothetical protein
MRGVSTPSIGYDEIMIARTEARPRGPRIYGGGIVQMVLEDRIEAGGGIVKLKLPHGG